VVEVEQDAEHVDDAESGQVACDAESWEGSLILSDLSAFIRGSTVGWESCQDSVPEQLDVQHGQTAILGSSWPLLACFNPSNPFDSSGRMLAAQPEEPPWSSLHPSRSKWAIPAIWLLRCPNNLPRIYENETISVIDARTETLSSLRELGPPDLVHLMKQPTKTGSSKQVCWHFGTRSSLVGGGLTISIDRLIPLRDGRGCFLIRQSCGIHQYPYLHTE
jgi:hypothetical protein